MKKFSYFVLLQNDATVRGKELFDAYRSGIPERIYSGAVAFQQTKAETIQKNGSILRGGLSHFLSTPLKSDKDEIIRLIEDSIENTVLQFDAAPVLTSVNHSVWRVMEPQQVPLQRQMVGVIKRLLRNGRTMLVNAGCSFGKNSGDVAVSLFEFDGFSTVQTLRSIVGTMTAEQQLTVVNGAVFSSVIAIGQDIFSEKNIAVIDFDDHTGTTADQLNERIPILLDQFGIQQITFSRQTLHSSVGAACQLRIGMDVTKHPLGSVIVSIIGDNTELEEAMTIRGSITMLEQFA
ncbi:MAG: hypothetical protein WCX28_09070 [Bacteriovoracaceae bacterium]|nr:hypothetical protein [Bacteroidota bacterium]